MKKDKQNQPGVPAWDKRPLIISGPCSAETEEQLIQTALRLKATGKVDVLRAGIWKPRTRPGNFEGVGVRGLPWLLQAKKLTGLPVATEVATAKQVEDALSFEVDILWIGARTTVNPFSVQEVSNALRGVDIPVFIKNPLNADRELWIGALERVSRSGVKKIGLIHRGFSAYGNMEFRNAPLWHLALEMKHKYAELPFLVDPSHICGNREMLPAVIQNAMNLNYDGLIIESHINPEQAWSDAQQQITPGQLTALLNEITWRGTTTATKEQDEKLALLRQQIDQLDDEALQLFNRRMKIAEKIGAYKKEQALSVLQKDRWDDILERVYKSGAKLGLSRAFMNQYFNAIHRESIRHQKRI